VLDTMDPALAEQHCDNLLDAAIFGPAVTPVRDVLVAGAVVVKDGRHRNEDAVFARYRAAMARLNAMP
jgi:formimidoylglutamate deiminase